MSQTIPQPLPVVILISGSGSNLQALIDRAAEIGIEIRAVISNKADAYGLQRAAKAGIASTVIDHRQYENRSAFDSALAAQIDHYQPALVVLAGFMRILTEEFVNHYLGRMLNIHPSLLPDFQGLNTHQRAIDAGAQQHGVSVHFVTPELDGGPVVIRATVEIKANDTADSLAARVQTQEHIIYPQAVAWFTAGRLTLQSAQAMLDGEPVPQLERQYT